jgi:3-oxoacyl-[acyl-carrier protein] reductase
MQVIDLRGKVALVTGSSRGIGLAIAQALAGAGADVIVNGRQETDALRASSTGLAQRYGVRSTAMAANVADSAEVGKLMQQVFKEHGRLDVLVNNAGILRDGLIGMIRASDMEETLNINLLGTLNCMQSGARLMARTGGSMINITSIIGVRGNSGQLAYSASKGGVIAATYSAAKELAVKGVRVNAIAPGYIDTDMIKAIPPAVHAERLQSIAMRRIGTAQDIAGCALFLASDLATYVTGQVIGVDGGMLI